MKAKNVFIGIVGGSIGAAVVANTIAEARAMMPGADVIKMTSKTKIFITFPDKFGSGKKLAISGETKQIKGTAYPQATVSIINGVIQFIAPIYINDEPVRDSIHVRFHSQLTGSSNAKLVQIKSL